MASVLAALLSLTIGFNWVLYSGAFCYLGAALIIFYPIILQKRSELIR